MPVIIAGHEHRAILRTERQRRDVVVVSSEAAKLAEGARVVSTAQPPGTHAQADRAALPRGDEVVLVGGTEPHDVDLLVVVRSTLSRGPTDASGTCECGDPTRRPNHPYIR